MPTNDRPDPSLRSLERVEAEMLAALDRFERKLAQHTTHAADLRPAGAER